MQTHKQTLIETSIKQIFSFFKNWFLSYALLHFVFGIAISGRANFWFTVAMFVQSFITEYLWRRFFNGREH